MKRDCLLPITIVTSTLLLAGCQHMPQNLPDNPHDVTSAKYFGKIERMDPALDALIAPGTKIEKLGENFDWSEGPVWIKNGGYLLFSDVPMNIIYKWQEGKGVSTFFTPSGYTGTIPRGGEPGSNGLTVDSQGRVTSCEHGDRRVGRLEKNGTKTTLVDKYQGKRLNSPNDLVYKSNGDLYFTDPPYGLVENVKDPKKELSFQGVYRVTTGGEVTLLTDELTRPNGLAFSPDEKILYVAVSDPDQAIWVAYDVKPDGTLGKQRLFYNVTTLVKLKKKGLPDGMKVDEKGNLFATGPGGVFVFSPEGKHLGTIDTGQATANCAWGDDGSTLYITADMYICRVKTKTRGKMP
jgi:gluconolactonase